MDNLQHAGAPAGAEVDGLHPGVGHTVVDGLQVPQRQVDHMDVVAHPSAVRCVVVIAVDLKLRQLADGDLGNIGQQVVRDAVGVLTDQSALVGADGVKVAQQHHAPLRVGGVQVAENLLDHHLGVAVGVGGGGGHPLFKGNRIVHAVDGGGGGKDNPLAAVLPHALAEHQGAGDIVVVIFQRLVDRLAHRF